MTSNAASVALGLHNKGISPLIALVIVLLHSLASRVVSGQNSGVVAPTLCAQGDPSCAPVLIQPTTDPGYHDCITKVGKQCVNGNGVRAQAPFDPITACPSTPIYGASGLLVDHQSLWDQARS